MNEESQAPPCGDTCGLVASMARTFREFLPTEQRMQQAIEAVLIRKMSQRAAAAEFGVARKTLGDHLARVGGSAHPTETQSSTEVSVIAQRSPRDRNELLRGLRQIASAAGITQAGNSLARKAGAGQLYKALTEAGHEVPAELIPKSFQPKTKKTITTTSNDQTTESAIDDDTLYIYQADAIRDEVCREVQQSSRPADFKRAIELLRELDVICTDAWYGRQSEPWGTFDWAHVSSEVRKIHSLVNQRAEEACEDYLAAQVWRNNGATSVS